MFEWLKPITITVQLDLNLMLASIVLAFKMNPDMRREAGACNYGNYI